MVKYGCSISTARSDIMYGVTRDDRNRLAEENLNRPTASDELGVFD